MWKSILNIVFRNFEIFNEVWEELLRVLATFTALDVICSLLTNIVFSIYIYFYPLGEVWQCAKTPCYRWYPFHLGLQNVHFSHLSIVIKQNFLYLGYVSDLISRFFWNFSLRRVLCMKAFDNYLFVKRLLFPRKHIYFFVAWWLSTFWQMLRNRPGFLTYRYLDYYELNY